MPFGEGKQNCSGLQERAQQHSYTTVVGDELHQPPCTRFLLADVFPVSRTSQNNGLSKLRNHDALLRNFLPIVATLSRRRGRRRPPAPSPPVPIGFCSSRSPFALSWGVAADCDRGLRAPCWSVRQTLSAVLDFVRSARGAFTLLSASSPATLDTTNVLSSHQLPPRLPSSDDSDLATFRFSQYRPRNGCCSQAPS